MNTRPKGFISLHRKLMGNPVWSDANYLKLWIFCLFEASHKERDQLIGNELVKLKRGQFVTGRKSLADEMNRGVRPKQQLSERTWFRYLKNLESWQMLTIKSTNKYSIVTIDNYDTYQNVFKKDDQDTVQQMTNKSPTDDQQLSTNNNVNNSNNVNNITTTEKSREGKNRLSGVSNMKEKNKIINRYLELKGSMHFTPKDEMAAEEIANENIPLDDVLRYLEDCFLDFETRKRHARDQINSLQYCVGYIFDRHYKKDNKTSGKKDKSESQYDDYDYGF